MATEQHSSQASNLDRRAAQKRAAGRAARRADSRRLKIAESPAGLQAENSVVSSGSFVAAHIANLWQATGK